MGGNGEGFDSVEDNHAGETAQVAAAFEGVGDVLRTADIGGLASGSEPLLAEAVPPVDPARHGVCGVAAVNENASREVTESVEDLRKEDHSMPGDDPERCLASRRFCDRLQGPASALPGERDVLYRRARVLELRAHRSGRGEEEDVVVNFASRPNEAESVELAPAAFRAEEYVQKRVHSLT
jgi:hypothetical protein